MKKITRIEPTASQPIMTKTKVAAYCRVSTEADAQLVSLETQKSHYEELISANPEWVFAGLYYDEGISGTSKEKRPALQRMIADCEAGKIDRVLVKSLSRFARNTTDCLELTRKLLGLGVTIYFEKENLDTGSMESELLLSIMSSLSPCPFQRTTNGASGTGSRTGHLRSPALLTASIRRTERWSLTRKKPGGSAGFTRRR